MAYLSEQSLSFLKLMLGQYLCGLKSSPKRTMQNRCQDAVIVELDEMWHFLHSKTQVWIWKA
jgi:hypothetical protein